MVSFPICLVRGSLVYHSRSHAQRMCVSQRDVRRQSTVGLAPGPARVHSGDSSGVSPPGPATRSESDDRNITGPGTTREAALPCAAVRLGNTIHFSNPPGFVKGRKVLLTLFHYKPVRSNYCTGGAPWELASLKSYKSE